MKKNIISLVIAGSMAIGITDISNAQVAMKESGAIASISLPKVDNFKKNSSVVAISLRTMQNFKRQFTNTDAAWYEIEDAYIAKFSENSIQTMVGYGKKGTWLYTIKRYSEKNLPREVRARVKSTYYDHMISHIDEVRVPKQENNIYIIHLRDGKNFKTLRVCDEEMDVIGEYHE